MALLLCVVAVAGAALAQSEPRRSPLGAGPSTTDARSPTATPDRGGVARWTDWLIEVQRGLHVRLSTAVKSVGADDPIRASVYLVFLSFAYGIFHAAGPGHGKAVIASYVLANERTVRRGIQLSFLSAFFQALSAFVLVGVLGLIFNVTGMKRRLAEAWLETASWGLIALLGAWLLYGQIRRFRHARQPDGPSGDHAHAHDHHHDHAGHAHEHGHEHGLGHVHSHSPDGGHAAGHLHTHSHVGPASHGVSPGHEHHDHDDGCDHAHLPSPAQLEGAWSWRRAFAMAFAIGIRPCTGAIVVLIFAIGQGLLWAGVLSTLAMAVGTAITVSMLASLAVGSRELAARLAGRKGRPWMSWVRQGAGLAGATAVFVLGVLFFWGSITHPAPF
jgi:ABC-type nickel/cobalt efflux system permease component RcnA